MPRFTYTAINSNKKTVRGTVTAENPYAARKHLRGKALHPVNIREVALDEEKISLGGLLKKSNKRQVADFTKQMSTMLNAGIKLTEALSVLAQQITDHKLRNAVADIKDRVVTGESLADALTEYAHYFDVIYVSMVRVGEVTGTLAQSLDTIAAFMEKRQRLESKMITAMVYPLVLLVMCFGVAVFLTVFLIPKIAGQMANVGQDLPWITQVMVNISEILTNIWWVLGILTGFIAFSIGLRKFLRTARGAVMKDKLILSLPIFGPLLKQRIVARFSSTLSTLLGSGMSMAESLKVVAEVTGNTIMNSAVRQARERILSGADIATPLRDSGVIDPTIAHMVTVGEKSGELDNMLRRISENLESNSDVVIDRMSAAIEPVIIVFMASIVGTIALAAFLPIFKYSATQF